MGGDQSKAQSASTAAVTVVEAGAEVPYTNAGVNKDGDSGIITIARAPARALVDPDLVALQNIPQFYPLKKSTVAGWSFEKKETLDTLDTKAVLAMIRSYQHYMKKCSVATEQEQRMIGGTIKQMEAYIGKALYLIALKAADMKKIESRFRDLKTMSIQLNAIRHSMEEIVDQCNRLNSLLPSRDQLQAVSFVSLTGKDEIACHAHSPACKVPGYPTSGVSACQGRRDSMEDAHVLFDCLGRRFQQLERTKHWAFYGVYDGHGGAECAKVAAKILHKTIMEQEPFANGNFAAAMRHGFLHADRKILAQAEQERWRDGATAVAALVVDNHLYVANAGDSEMVLARRAGLNANGEYEYEAQLVTKVHKPTDMSEIERIERAGGNVFLGRVSGTLAVSRALGDSAFKSPLNRSNFDFVTAEPYVNDVALTSENEFMVVACDGLWDVFKYYEVIDYIAARRRVANLSPEAIAKELSHDAIFKRGSRDNVTVVIVFLTDPAVPPPPQQQQSSPAATPTVAESPSTSSPAMASSSPETVTTTSTEPQQQQPPPQQQEVPSSEVVVSSPQ